MTAIGIDTHKATLAACRVDPLGRPLDEREFPNDEAGHRAIAAWVLNVPGARVGIEGSSTFGAALARRLVAEGLDVRRYRPTSPRAAGSGPGGPARATPAMPSSSPGSPCARTTCRRSAAPTGAGTSPFSSTPARRS